MAFAIVDPIVNFTDINALTGLRYPKAKEIADYLIHQLLLQETGDGQFILTDTIRNRYEDSIDQRDQVGTMSGPSWH